jgi:protein-tyrosine phosphatase
MESCCHAFQLGVSYEARSAKDVSSIKNREHDADCATLPMIDLHCHYLPDVDDGAGTPDEALALIRAALADGIRCAVLTPHVHPGRYDNRLSGLRPRFDALRDIVHEQGLDIDLRLGGEVRLLPESLEWLAEGELPMVGSWEGQRLVLLELPHDHIPPGSLKAVDWLQARGVRTLIAHPERNGDVRRDVRRIAPFVEAGCLLQLTAASVCGLFGAPPAEAARRMLDAGWATVVASDAHNLVHRPPVMAQARTWLAQHYGEDAAEQLVAGNPSRILAAL